MSWECLGDGLRGCGSVASSNQPSTSARKNRVKWSGKSSASLPGGDSVVQGADPSHYGEALEPNRHGAPPSRGEPDATAEERRGVSSALHPGDDAVSSLDNLAAELPPEEAVEQDDYYDDYDTTPGTTPASLPRRLPVCCPGGCGDCPNG